MKKRLLKYKLLENIKIELPIAKTDFIKKLQPHIETGGFGMFSSAFEIFSSSNFEMVGYINQESFKIRRKRKMFEPYASFAIAEGKFQTKDENLELNIEITAWRSHFKYLAIFLLLFYGLFILGSLMPLFVGSEEAPVFIVPMMLGFLIFHGCIMFGAFYFISRRSVKKLKHFISREFHYIATKN